MLELYGNIKRFRKELKMSQEDLAKKTGYTDRSSIAKIEKGMVDLPQSKILLFAEALNVTPGELMGNVDDTVPTNGQESEYYLDEETREIVELMHKDPQYRTLFSASRRLSKEDLQIIMSMIERMS